jgi:hypothetical protein
MVMVEQEDKYFSWATALSPDSLRWHNGLMDVRRDVRKRYGNEPWITVVRHDNYRNQYP